MRSIGPDSNLAEVKQWLEVTSLIACGSYFGLVPPSPDYELMGLCVSKLLQTSARTGEFTIEVVDFLSKAGTLDAVWNHVDRRAVRASFAPGSPSKASSYGTACLCLDFAD